MHTRIFCLLPLLALLLLPQSAFARWTGIAAFAGQQQSDWQLGALRREADIFSYGLSIEEKTRPGLRIGIGAGQWDLRLKDRVNQTPIDDFDGQFFLFYLRWPFRLADALSLRTRFDYQYHNGNTSDQDPSGDDISWTEVAFSAGLALRIEPITLRPFVRYRSVDGDISGASNAVLIEHSDNRSYGLMLDIHVEPTAFVRLHSSFSAVDSISISFIREY